MKRYLREDFKFLGLSDDNSKYEDSKYIILPVPYDCTTSYNNGTRNGPRAIIEASMQVELFDAQVERDVSSKISIHTLNEIEPDFSSPENMVNRIKSVCNSLRKDNKFIITIGGEHTVSLGPVFSHIDEGEEFSVLQIDAHSDLRDSYEGTKFNHACVMRRIHELGIHIVPVGIRSMDETEYNYIKDNKICNKFYGWKVYNDKFNPDLIIDELKDNVYLTIDVDGFDPSIFPGTGTPEPGGIGWYQFIELFKKLSVEKNIIGIDLVEIIPDYKFHISEYSGAKLIYKMISLMELAGDI